MRWLSIRPSRKPALRQCGDSAEAGGRLHCLLQNRPRLGEIARQLVQIGEPDACGDTLALGDMKTVEDAGQEGLEPGMVRLVEEGLAHPGKRQRQFVRLPEKRRDITVRIQPPTIRVS